MLNAVAERNASAGQGPEASRGVERAMGIEPTAQAWEAWVLPLYDARAGSIITRSPRRANCDRLAGFLSSAEAATRPLLRSRPASPPGKRPPAGTRWRSRAAAGVRSRPGSRRDLRARAHRP